MNPPRFITDLDEARGTLPVVLVAADGGRTRRHALHRALIARILSLDESDVALGHDAAGRPLAAVAGVPDVEISRASRGGTVALAVARRPVGVDVEAVDAAAEPPWAVLHPAERAALSRREGLARAQDFAAIWAAKEAWVKALGTGFGREPSSFAAELSGGEASIRDGAVAARVALHWPAPRSLVVALVVLGSVP